MNTTTAATVTFTKVNDPYDGQGWDATTPAGITRFAKTREQAARVAMKQEQVYRASGELENVLATLSTGN